MLEMRAGPRLVAAQCNILAGEGAFCFKIGFDATLGRYSPGVQLELENLRGFHDYGLAWMDSCADPDNETINRLWPDRLRLSSRVLVERGVLGTATGAALRMAGRMRHRRELVSR